jgi:hypothetical protein
VRSRASRFEGFELGAAFAGALGLCAALAFGFYWLLKPTVFQNQGLAAYKAPPKTVVSAVPWVPPEPGSEVFTSYAKAEPAPEPKTVAPKDEKKAHEVAQAPRRERAVRARPAPSWNSDTAGRSWGWRPWF